MSRPVRVRSSLPSRSDSIISHPPFSFPPSPSPAPPPVHNLPRPVRLPLQLRSHRLPERPPRSPRRKVERGAQDNVPGSLRRGESERRETNEDGRVVLPDGGERARQGLRFSVKSQTPGRGRGRGGTLMMYDRNERDATLVGLNVVSFLSSGMICNGSHFPQPRRHFYA